MFMILQHSFDRAVFSTRNFDAENVIENAFDFAIVLVVKHEHDARVIADHLRSVFCTEVKSWGFMC